MALSALAGLSPGTGATQTVQGPLGGTAVQVPAVEPPAPPPGPAAAPVPADAANANAEVLQAWQAQTGQAVWLASDGQVEFHGSAALDAYGNRSRNASGNPALTGQRQGDYGRLLLQGDVRSTSPESDVTYLQAVGTATDDRGVMPRYGWQVNSLQAGRAGNGYQIAVGDVVGAFSSLGSNLGLRGVLLARETEQLTGTAFAGSVAESWEALALRGARDGLSPRTRYLRDVYGLKIDWRHTAAWSSFATVQGWEDRPRSAPTLAYAPQPTRGGTATAGARYTTLAGQWVAELARSQRRDLQTGTAARGNGFVIDGSQRFDNLGVRAGWHDLDAGFATLAPYAAPGVREWYLGGDWTIAPGLVASLDLRHGISRIAAVATLPGSVQAVPTPVSLAVEPAVIEILQDTLNARVSYSPGWLPGLAFNASELRNKNTDALQNRSLANQTQVGAGYAFGLWNLQASVTAGRNRTPAAPQADSDTSQWQLGAGRSLQGAPDANGVPGWTLSAQAFVSGFSQELLATGATTRNRVTGLSMTWAAQADTTVSAILQVQATTQPIAGRPALATRSLSVDGNHRFTPQWSGRFYLRYDQRNQGDALLQVSDHVLGIQLTHQW